MNDINLDLSKRYTVKDYLSWNFDVRLELIDGVVKLMSGVRLLHSDITQGLTRVLSSFKERKKIYRSFHAPFDVFFSDVDVVQPDFGIVCDLSICKNDGIHGTPDFLVEVLSSTLTSKRQDLYEKFQLYQKYGVREYWIIDPDDKSLIVYLLQSDGKYNAGVLYEYKEDSTIKLSVVDLEIGLSDIFD